MLRKVSSSYAILLVSLQSFWNLLSCYSILWPQIYHLPEIYARNICDNHSFTRYQHRNLFSYTKYSLIWLFFNKNNRQKDSREDFINISLPTKRVLFNLQKTCWHEMRNRWFITRNKTENTNSIKNIPPIKRIFEQNYLLNIQKTKMSFECFIWFVFPR